MQRDWVPNCTVAPREDSDLEPLEPIDPMLAPPEAFAPVREETGETGETGEAREAGEQQGEKVAGGPVARPRRSRLRLGLVVAVVVLGVLAGAAALTQGMLDRRTAHHAAATFSVFQVDDYLLSQQTAAINDRMVPDDQPKVDLVLARAEREAIARDTGALRGLHAPFWLEGSTRRLVASVRAALTARIADLRSLLAWRARPVAGRGPQPQDPSTTSKELLDRATALAARQITKLPPLPTAAGAANIVDSLNMANYSDKPTGSTLAVADVGGVARVDVDASSATNLNLAGTAQAVVGRNGYVAVITRSGVALAKPPVGDAETMWLGPAQELLPAAQPYAVWLVNSARTGQSPETTVVAEVDGTGQRILGPVAIPTGQYITGGVTDTGLVLSGGGQGLSVWDARTGQERSITLPGATLLAAAPGVVAWQGETEALVNVTDVRSGATRSIALPGQNRIVADLDVASTTCTFSPDASQLACPVLDLGSVPRLGTPFAPYHLGIIDLDEGSAQVLGGAAGTGDAHPIVWSPDGSRVWSVVASEQGSLLATWGAGQSAAREVRYRVGNWLVGVAVLEQRPTTSP
jgi:hypothetical protein